MLSRETKLLLAERRAELQRRREHANHQTQTSQKIRKATNASSLTQRTARESKAVEDLLSELALKDAMQARKFEIERRAAEAAKKERQTSQLWHSPTRTAGSSPNMSSSSPSFVAGAAAAPIANTTYERLMGNGVNKLLLEHQRRRAECSDRSPVRGIIDTYVIQQGAIGVGQAPVRWK